MNSAWGGTGIALLTLKTVIRMTADQALCHLFFHFARQDGQFDEAEIDFIAAKTVALGLQTSIDFKTEVGQYIQSRKEWTDNRAYYEYIVLIIKPVNKLAVFSWCVEICLMDELITVEEEQLLDQLANVLEIEDAQRDTIKDLLVERKAADLNKTY